MAAKEAGLQQPDELNPIYWQRQFEEGAYRLADLVAVRGYPDRELFVTGYALNQISGDDFNLVGHFREITDIKTHHLESGDVRRAELLGRMSFELSRQDIPDDVRHELENTQAFIGNTPWNSVINIWKSHQAFSSFHRFFEMQKSGEMSKAYNYAINAQISLVGI